MDLGAKPCEKEELMLFGLSGSSSYTLGLQAASFGFELRPRAPTLSFEGMECPPMLCKRTLRRRVFVHTGLRHSRVLTQVLPCRLDPPEEKWSNKAPKLRLPRGVQRGHAQVEVGVFGNQAFGRSL